MTRTINIIVNMKAVITGGTKGVGLECVKMLSSLQIPILFTGRDNVDIQQVEHQIPNTKGYVLDLTSPSSVVEFTKSIQDQPVSILIHNAGYLSTKPVESYDHVQKLFQVNTFAPMYMTQQLLPTMNHGHIVFVSPSYQIDDKVKYLTPYMQSKLAQTTYMKSISHIVNQRPISVNSIWTKYPLWTNAIEHRKIGTVEQCMRPDILSKMVEVIVTKEDPTTFKGNELLDSTYLPKHGIDLQSFQCGENVELLDELFLKTLTKKHKK